MVRSIVMNLMASPSAASPRMSAGVAEASPESCWAWMIERILAANGSSTTLPSPVGAPIGPARLNWEGMNRKPDWVRPFTMRARRERSSTARVLSLSSTAKVVVSATSRSFGDGCQMRRRYPGLNDQSGVEVLPSGYRAYAWPVSP